MGRFKINIAITPTTSTSTWPAVWMSPFLARWAPVGYCRSGCTVEWKLNVKTNSSVFAAVVSFVLLCFGRL